MTNNQYSRQNHGFGPVYDEHSQILILGSFPSVKSREQQFYYGHPQNRFWKLLANILEVTLPDTIEEKQQLLLANHIALWDVIEDCDIVGSSDSSIKNITPTDIKGLLEKTQIRKIYANGNLAYKLYKKHTEEITGIKIDLLPSSSSANAAYSLERLTKIWKEFFGEIS